MRVLRAKAAIVLACALGMGGATVLSAPAFCQPAPAPADYLEKSTVTGTHIPTIGGQSGLPVQVITREEIERANIQTAAQLVETVSATMSFSAFNETRGLFSVSMPGFAAAALRGLGFQATLILLNGRRIANFAFTTIGGDLNSIPVSAIDRVEVLKDGASAIYGSDAIGGVINFILRKNYQGAEVYVQSASPEHTGGYSQRFNLSAGHGDLNVQKFNAYATVDYQKYGGIQARDRSFARTAYVPTEGLDRTNVNSFPANVNVAPNVFRNPTGNPGNGYNDPACAPPLSFPTAGFVHQCRYDPQTSASIYDPNERVNLVGAFTWQLDSNNQFFVNSTYVRNKFTFAISPLAVSSLTTFQGAHFSLPPTSAYYPHDFARAFNLDGKPLDIYWRALELGRRTIEPITDQWSVVAGMKGVVKGWDYDGAFNYNQSSVDSRYTDGYVRESVLLPILNSGAINPFGPNTQQAIDLMSTAKVNQTLRTGKASVASVDFRAANDVYAMPAGPLAVSIGLDARQEKLTQVSDPALESGDILTATSIGSLSGTRRVWAVFAEASVPLLRSVEANLALRYDHYSDFGSTTNPKLSLRWEPAPTLLLRAAAGTGFFAPSLPGLFGPPSHGFTVGTLNNGRADGARCPFTGSEQDCRGPFPTLGGGNPQLQPATSTQWSVGGAWAPAPGLSVGVDYVAILLDNRINFFSSSDIFRLCPDGVTGPTCYLIHRGAVDQNYPTLPGPIVQVDQFLTNLGKGKVTAIDFNFQYKAPTQVWGRFTLAFNGTYNIQNKLQQLGGSYVNQVDHYIGGGTPGTIPYWRHYLVLTWDYGPWSATLTENYQTGAYDENSGSVLRRIGDYAIWNISAAYMGFRNWTLAAGIKNLMDRDPPFSNQTQNSQVGYDPSSADVHGRLFWLGLKYAFK